MRKDRERAISRVAKAVRGFLRGMKWRWHEVAPTRYEVLVHGRSGHWVWLAQWEEDDSFFSGHSISPVSVPAGLRARKSRDVSRSLLAVGEAMAKLYSSFRRALQTSRMLNHLEKPICIEIRSYR